VIVFRPIADHAMMVEFAEAISEPAHDAVLQLDRALAMSPFDGFEEAIPAYVNLVVLFDPLVTDHATVEAHLRACLDHPVEGGRASTVREVLVCYDGEFSPDLADVAARTGLSVEAVINAHVGADYRVFMYGFAPGYAYLAGVPETIRLPRKSAPVRGIDAGAVVIAGPQCLVSTLKMPTGWWIIGRSPTAILTDDSKHPFLFDVGDHVKFRRISRSEFDIAMQRRLAPS
jgi:inhibitor of KinA